MPDGAARVAVLLSTFDGARFLDEQLRSLLAQTHADWTLYWRDDGSADGTPALMERFAAGPGRGRCVRVAGDGGRLGVTGSFMALLRAAGEADAVAFADQDDVWLPDKLARGVAALAGEPAPALYCARQVLVDECLARIGLSRPLRQPPGFPTALTQNLATGCTVMLNPAAAALVGRSRVPSATLHDWWCYLLVAAAGGRLLMDDAPTVLYRQHPGNLVGAPPSDLRRGLMALKRGPGVFMRTFRAHVDALRAQPELLTRQARAALDAIDAALRDGTGARLAALRLPGLVRQTPAETLLFRAWFLLG